MKVVDNFEKTFSKESEMKLFLEERAKGKKWIKGDLYSLIFHNISCGPLFLGEVRDKLKLGADISDEAILSTITDGAVMGMDQGSEFAVTLDGTNYLLDSVALYSAAMMLIGKVNKFAKLSTQNKLEALKVFLSLKEHKEVNFLYCYEKIRTVQSSKYAIMEQEELFQTLEDYLDENYFGSQFQSGYYNHNLTKATWALPEQKEELLDKYLDTCKAAGITTMADFDPCIEFQTSDTGDSAVTIVAKLVRGGFEIPIGNALKLDHLSSHGIEDFKENLDSVWMQYKDLTSLLTALIDIKIEHTTSCMRAVGAFVGIPQNALEKAVDTFATIYGAEEEVNAHDIFFALEEAVYEMSLSKMAASTIERTRENLARTLVDSFDWKSFDKI